MFLSIILYTINPLELNPLNTELLYNVLTNNKVQRYWPQEHIFIFENRQIQLTHSLLLIPSREKKLSCVVIAYHEQLGEGSYASLHPCSCIMVFEETQKVNYCFYNRYVAKIQNKACADSSRIEVAYHLAAIEARNLQNIAHLRTGIEYYRYKSQNEVCTVLLMRRMLGMELFALAEKNINAEYYIASSIKLQITLALLKAFKKQVVDYNIYHGDIKLENIMIDLGFDVHNMPFQLEHNFLLSRLDINFIDYAGCTPFNQKRTLFIRTDGYVAPELDSFFNLVTNEKADLFSLGQVLWVFWGFEQQKLIFERNNTGIDTHVIDRVYDSFYARESEDPTKYLLHEIHRLIQSMKHHDINQRPLLVDVLKDAHAISSQYTSGAPNSGRQYLSLLREEVAHVPDLPIAEAFTENQQVSYSSPIFDFISGAGRMLNGFFPSTDVKSKQNNLEQESRKIPSL